jgi:exopolysaccharide production protein ExoQ
VTVIDRANPGVAAVTAAVPRKTAAKGARGPVLGTLAIYVLVVFMIVPEGFVYDYTGARGMPTEGSPTSRITWLALLAFGVFVVGSRWAKAKALLRQINPYFLAFVGLAALSVLWSVEPTVTIRRLVRLVTFLLDGMALALLPWSQTRFQSVLRPVLTGMLLGSIIFVLTNPVLAIEQSTQFELLGAWRGLATQKNGLGSIASIATLLWLQAWLNRESKLWWILIGGAAAVVCLVSSRSSTSIMATTFACILLLMLSRTPRGLRRYMPYLIGVFVVTLVVYSLAVLNLVPGLAFILRPITMLTGKDMTFSGRTAIWAIINDHIANSPLIGSGYGAYWIGEGVPTSPSYEMTRRLYWYPGEGHNGYLDVINDLGFAGAAVLLAFLFTYVRQGLRLFRTARAQGALFLALLFQQLIANLSESRWFNVLSVEFVVVTLATVCLGRVLLEQDLERKASARMARAAPR